MNKEVTVKNYQELAMRTCLESSKKWDYCYSLIVSELGAAVGKWGKLFRDGKFDKDKLIDKLGDVFWGLALACELGGYSFEELWTIDNDKPFIETMFSTPNYFADWDWALEEKEVWNYLAYTKTFAKECGIDPLDCLKRNIAKLADRQERGVIKGNGDERMRNE